MLVRSEHISLWTDDKGRPCRFVWQGERYRVTDTPTPLEDFLLAITHPPAVGVGWRFQGTTDAGDSHIFDVRYEAESGRWTLLRVYD